MIELQCKKVKAGNGSEQETVQVLRDDVKIASVQLELRLARMSSN